MNKSFSQNNSKPRIQKWFYGSAIVIGCLSMASIQVEAQSAFTGPNTEAAYTPVGYSPVSYTTAPSNASQAAQHLTFAALSPTQVRAAPTSPMPRFNMAEAAGRYAALVREADRVANLPSLSTAAIAQALYVTSQTSGKGISEGAGAYASQIAANHGEFAAGLRTTVNLMGRDAVLARLRTDPDTFLAMISGSHQAVRNASGALHASAAKLARAETILGEAAYSVQTQSWSQAGVDTQAALAAHRHAATVPLESDQLVTTGFDAQASDAPLNSRYLLAASYLILGEDVAATEVLDKPLGRMCMNRVQLNVRQCLAASQYPYEHLFCLSRHSFGETLGCVKDVVK